MLIAVPTAPSTQEFYHHHYILKEQKFTVFWLSVKHLLSLLEQVGFIIIDTKSKDSKVEGL